MTDAPGLPAAPSPADRLAGLVALWQRACTDFLSLLADLPDEEWQADTDLAGWTVRDVVAHTAHLEAVLAGTPEETLEVADAPHLRTLMSHYTEQGVLARRDRDPAALVEEISRAVETRRAALGAEPPTDPAGAPPKTPGDVGWDWQTLLSNRPLDVWMHEQDVRQALGRPGGFDSPVAGHVIDVFGRALPMVVGKRVSPPAGTTVRLDIPDADRSWTVSVGEDGRARLAEPVADPTATITLSPEDFVVLAGGRRAPETTQPRIEGDEDLAHRLLASLAVTP